MKLIISMDTDTNVYIYGYIASEFLDFNAPSTAQGGSLQDYVTLS